MASSEWPDPFLEVLRFKREVDRGRYVGGPEPGFPDLRRTTLAKALVREEFLELCEAMEADDLVATADAVADLLYVTYGVAVTLGFDVRPVFAEVHRTNMLKAGAPDNEMGKILKPEGWLPPDVAGAIQPLPPEGDGGR